MGINYSGKYLLITGGSSDLALDLAKHAMNAFLFPIVTYRNDHAKNIIEKELGMYSGKFVTALLDFGDLSTITSFVSSFQQIDYLVDYAQGDFESYIASASLDEMQNYFSENIISKALLIKELSRIMIERRRGKMIYISSTAAERINPGQGFYSAAKNAAEALYKTTGIELGKKGITTLSIRLGYTDTGRGSVYYNNNHNIIKNVPITRLVSMQEVSDSIMFFLSDNATAFNATEIVLDGGLTSLK